MVEPAGFLPPQPVCAENGPGSEQIRHETEAVQPVPAAVPAPRVPDEQPQYRRVFRHLDVVSGGNWRVRHRADQGQARACGQFSVRTVSVGRRNVRPFHTEGAGRTDRGGRADARWQCDGEWMGVSPWWRMAGRVFDGGERERGEGAILNDDE